jgi:predicted nucleic acid-binding protein
MRGAVLVDTGPIVALLDPSDSARAPCRAALEALGDTALVTTEAVVTEAAYLLDFSADAQKALMLLLASGRPRVEPVSVAERSRLAELIEKYRDLPMDYADATLVALAERLGTMRVFTLDRRDFGVYRVGRRRFDLIPK